MLGFIGSIGVEGGQGNADCIFTTCDDHDRKDITIFPSTLLAFVDGAWRERIVLCLLGARRKSSFGKLFGAYALSSLSFVQLRVSMRSHSSCCPVSVVVPFLWPSWNFRVSKSYVSVLKKTL